MPVAAAGRQDGEAADADENEAQQKGYREQAAFIVDDAVDGAGARDPHRNHGGGDDGREGKRDAGDQGGD